mmetsp:Transcript_9301/g.19895  ORF Transcript_9301/g.19895 Transcript_9301/m.19895 type:complete len:201 (+) Transcript_9301:2967-3569(+)
MSLRFSWGKPAVARRRWSSGWPVPPGESSLCKTCRCRQIRQIYLEGIGRWKYDTWQGKSTLTLWTFLYRASRGHKIPTFLHMFRLRSRKDSGSDSRSVSAGRLRWARIRYASLPRVTETLSHMMTTLSLHPLRGQPLALLQRDLKGNDLRVNLALLLHSLKEHWWMLSGPENGCFWMRSILPLARLWSVYVVSWTIPEGA